MPETLAVRLLFRGRVQGVNFRAFTKEHAESLCLQGYAKNLADGNFEVYAEGLRPKLLGFIESIMDGPPAARVTSVSTDWLQPTGNYTAFTVIL
jgi:acylphosphatase